MSNLNDKLWSIHLNLGFVGFYRKEVKNQEKTSNLAKEGSRYCHDKAKNYYNKEMSKWPEGYHNNTFFVSTKNQ